MGGAEIVVTRLWEWFTEPQQLMYTYMVNKLAMSLLSAKTLCLACVVLVLTGFTATSSAPLHSSSYYNSLESLKAKISGPYSSLTCEACKVIVTILQQLFAQNASEEEIAKIVVRVCIDLKIEDENVCTLVVPTFQVKQLMDVNLMKNNSESIVSPLFICVNLWHGYMLSPTARLTLDSRGTIYLWANK